MVTYADGIIFPCFMRKKPLKLLWHRSHSIVNMFWNLTPFLPTSVFILGTQFYEYGNQLFLATDKHSYKRGIVQHKDNKSICVNTGSKSKFLQLKHNRG